MALDLAVLWLVPASRPSAAEEQSGCGREAGTLGKEAAGQHHQNGHGCPFQAAEGGAEPGWRRVGGGAFAKFA